MDVVPEISRVLLTTSDKLHDSQPYRLVNYYYGLYEESFKAEGPKSRVVWGFPLCRLIKPMLHPLSSGSMAGAKHPSPLVGLDESLNPRGDCGVLVVNLEGEGTKFHIGNAKTKSERADGMNNY